MRWSSMAALALCAPALLYASGALAAPKSNQVSWSASFTDDSWRTGGSYLHNWANNLAADGVLTRLDLTFSGIALDSSNLAITRGDALLGYQWTTGGIRLRVLGGVDIVDRDFSNPGPSAIEGTFTGFRTTGQLSTTSAMPLYLGATGTYATELHQYSTGFQAGWRFAGMIVGVEGGLSGSDTFKGEKVGVFLSGIKLGQLSLSPSAGYSFGGDEDEGKDSPYGELSASLQF